MKELSKLIEIAVKDGVGKDTMRQVAEASAEMIRNRTRRGKGVKKSKGSEIDLAKKKNGKKSTLTDTGQMLDSLVGRSAGESEAVVTILDKRKKGSNIEISGFHQFGTSNMPARPFLNLSKTEAEKAAKLLEKIMGEKVNRKLIKFK